MDTYQSLKFTLQHRIALITDEACLRVFVRRGLSRGFAIVSTFAFPIHRHIHDL